MYKSIFQRTKPALVAAMLGYHLLSPSTGYAQSRSAELSVSVTVIGPAEIETRTIGQDGNISAWEKAAPEVEYIVTLDSDAPSSIDNYINGGDYSWLHNSPKLQEAEVESEAFYDNLTYGQVSSGVDIFEMLKSTLLKLFPARDYKDEYGF